MNEVDLVRALVERTHQRDAEMRVPGEYAGEALEAILAELPTAPDCDLRATILARIAAVYIKA